MINAPSEARRARIARALQDSLQGCARTAEDEEQRAEKRRRQEVQDQPEGDRDGDNVGG